MKYLVQIFDWHTEKLIHEEIVYSLEQISLVQDEWYDRGYSEWEFIYEA